MPNIHDDGRELESALEQHHQFPDRFQIPSEEERSNLQPGDMVQMVFLLLGQDETGSYIQGERMWVTVQKVTTTSYTGVLESLPVTSDVLHPGDTVQFGPEHVASILIRKTDLRHPDYAGG
jgi:hypothetical protein